MTELAPGPWQSAFATPLPVKLRSKSNYRRGSKGWAALTSFEQVAAATFLRARPSDWDTGSKHVAVKDRPSVVIAIAASSLVDSTNFTKSIADAAQGVLVVTDASIIASSTLALRSAKDQRCVVAFAQLPAGATMREQAAALTALLAQLPDLFEQA